MLKIPSFFLRERLRVNRKRQYVLSKHRRKISLAEIYYLSTNRTIPVNFGGNGMSGLNPIPKSRMLHELIYE